MSSPGSNGSASVSSPHVPYIPVRIEIPDADTSLLIEALVDTGFNGEVALPAASLHARPSVLGNLDIRMADGSEISVPVYLGTIQIGSRRIGPITVLMLGDEPIIGLGVATQFRVVIDHDQSISFSP